MVASLPLIQWAIANGCKETTKLLWSAVIRSPFEVVLYLHALGAQWGIDAFRDTWLCRTAAERGHLEMLQWVRAQGFAWGTCTSTAAARRGHLEVLRLVVMSFTSVAKSVAEFARRASCSICSCWRFIKVSSRTASGTDMWTKVFEFLPHGRYLQLSSWLQDIGYPLDPSACMSAVHVGRLDILQWLRERGCPWDGERTMRHVTSLRVTAVSCQKQLSTAEWALANGCPCSDDCRARIRDLRRELDAAEARRSA
ncbi:hypothetical protein JKP88DRAFT_277227 [Tribonema minus]|uniref:Ankyrin repeat protein n=1 Tax=Tribonema minus TaxID=303371 RepID=A0A835Z2I4_9STRA|nr:hypothetical protein JKP88DRAFT_277227 [Tribonema minus]